MNSRRWAAIFAAEGAICAALTLWMRGTAFFDVCALAFPFAQLGTGLRALSLLGGGWNALAIILYAGISLAPLAAFTARSVRRGFHAEELLLPLLTITLFGALYAMINPAMLDGWIAGGRELGLPMLGGILYTELLAYLVLRLLRAAFGADTVGLRRCFRAVLLVLTAIFVYCAFGAQLQALLTNWKRLLDGNTSGVVGNLTGGRSLGLTQLFLILRYLTEAAPYLLDVWVIAAALELLTAREKKDADLAANAAEQIARRCRIGLGVSVLSELALDILQELAGRMLLSTAFSVTLPLSSIAFCLAALLLVRLMQENRKLRADNDLFI